MWSDAAREAAAEARKGSHASGTTATPQLERRHFEQIAAELRSASDAGSAAHAQRVQDTADKLATTNPRFNRAFFVAAATGGNYRFKGPGKNAGAVARKASKFTGA